MTEVSCNINTRNLVLEMLLETEKGKKSHMIQKETLDEHMSLSKQQRAFITRLYQGTLERRIELDYIINYFSKTPVNKMKSVIREILRMSVYQIKYMDSVPTAAVCNEAVKLTEKRKFTGLKGFVNGVLRNIAANINSIKYPNERTKKLSVAYSVPIWIIDMWDNDYGKDVTLEILKGLYREKHTWVRCNTLRKDVRWVEKSLESSGIKTQRSPLYENALLIRDYDRISGIKEFNEGVITVQDLSSMMAGLAANPQKDDYIIDMCAAPGGKSLHMAEMLQNTGKVEARDLTAGKVCLIEENNSRMKYKNITTVVMDATKLDEKSIEEADIVMADLPCSGLGVMGEKSDIKYKISREQIEELISLQRKILVNACNYLKLGGRLIFSTCTVNKSENQNNVEWIEENLPLKLSSLEGLLPKELGGEKGYVQIFPGQYGMDGFFISAFTKQNKTYR